MAKEMYVGIGDVAKQVGKMYVGIDGVARKVKKAYVGVDGIARLFFEGNVPYYALLYSNGSMVFQLNDTADSDKTLKSSYSFYSNSSFMNESSTPWNSNTSDIINVSFKGEVAPDSMAFWFFNAQYMTSFNTANLNINATSNMALTYYNCRKLAGSPICGENVTNMYCTYHNCTNLTGNPVCGNKVTDMSATYNLCSNLTGSPVCGNNVRSMILTYYNCYKLTGTPVCGDKVSEMHYAYTNCTNLTGSPVCGNNVITMQYAYANCVNLTGAPVCGSNVVNMRYAYHNCKNINAGTFYFYSNNVSDATNCFYGKNNYRRYNIHIPANSTTLNTFLINNTSSLVGSTITWTNAGTYYYNTAYNIYIYPNTSM